MARGHHRGRRPIRRREPEHRVNDRIRAREVRLVGDNVEVGVYALDKAKEIASDLELDLVEISPNADPPVCKVIDYGKFLYDKKKKEKEMKANAQKTVVKEIRFGPNTDEHDIEFKLKHATKFLEEGSKVRAYVFFKGRSIIYRERGEVLLLQFAESLSEMAKVEQMPKMEGKKMIMMLAPKGTKK